MLTGNVVNPQLGVGSVPIAHVVVTCQHRDVSKAPTRPKKIDEELRSLAVEAGVRLKRVREHLGMSQPALADRSGITKGDIARLERGERPRASIAIWSQLADALHISLDWLWLGKGEEPSVLKLQAYPTADGRTREHRAHREQIELAAKLAKPAHRSTDHIVEHTDPVTPMPPRRSERKIRARKR